ncbi:MAG TPA: PEP-CTERM sorting domain-containing protein [Verrucomicrobiae bacterium]|jgi:hypothetical protein|nr:PEP-CTERM sorting domain-containing protein [Verrucomicrobiae bacterium]
MRLILILLGVGASLNADAQGLFQNLDFESANPGPTTQGLGPPYAENIPVAQALPGWSVFYGSVPQSAVNYNAPGTGATLGTLIGDGFPHVAGNYSVLLQGGLSATAASIEQTGLIPVGTESLTFEAQPGGGPLALSIGSQAVPFFAVGSGANYTLYSADISAWSGQSEQLTFSALNNDNVNDWALDNITFSTAAVPEPSPLVLLGVGGAMFALYQLLMFRKPWRRRSIPS